MIHALLSSFVRDRRANVALLFGLLALPLVFSVGMAIDYGAAARRTPRPSRRPRTCSTRP
jgi:Flp pilus assembly protein TadG